jgi:hypothetical protein
MTEPPTDDQIGSGRHPRRGLWPDAKGYEDGFEKGKPKPNEEDAYERKV